MGISKIRSLIIAFVVALFALGAPVDVARAAGTIKSPGAHNRYSWELEPQLAIRSFSPSWGDGYTGRLNYYGNGVNGWVGVGPGLRATIPFMHNGPITSINNNIAISFGGSITWHSSNTGPDAVVFNAPVAFQWNFYFTDIISVLGEVGLNAPMTFYDGNSHFTVEPLFQGGGRFQFGKVGVLVRIGWPLISVGANFQF